MFHDKLRQHHCRYFFFDLLIQLSVRFSNRTACVIYSIDVMKIINNNPERWFKSPMLLVDGGPPWDFHWDESCFAEGEVGREQAAELCTLIRDIILNVGGAIPRIVNNDLDNDGEWRKQLIDAAEETLDVGSLKNLAEALANTPIYVTGYEKLVSVPADVDAKIFWTLSPEQFQRKFVTEADGPDLSQARLLVFVRSLQTVQSHFEVFHCNHNNDKVRGNACLGILGSAVKVLHECTHGARWRKCMLLDFNWIRLDSGWGLSLEEIKKKAATPEKLVGYRVGKKEHSLFPADAGRLWEQSLTGGGAIVESSLVLVGVAVRNQDSTDMDSAREELLSERLTEAEGLEIMGDLKKLLTVMRTRAVCLGAQCRKGYSLATYVACSRDLIRCTLHCIPSDSSGHVTTRLRPLRQVSVSVPGFDGMDDQQLRGKDPV
jgi:hypothetical protein